MKKTWLIAILCGAAVAPLTVIADPAPAPQYSKSEIRRLIASAHTADQYRTLAAYFRSQQQHFEREAQVEKAEWQRRSENVSGPAAKYPRPVDSSRNRYEYFAYEAQEMDRQAAHYESLSAGAK